mmetsp:Transcript_6438/g.9372  ORF Transcript_6438/g.9372 Transcript_6438/m.9372 type:complete len:232 (+) Transcript_6438:26-721(+)
MAEKKKELLVERRTVAAEDKAWKDYVQLELTTKLNFENKKASKRYGPTMKDKEVGHKTALPHIRTYTPSESIISNTTITTTTTEKERRRRRRRERKEREKQKRKEREAEEQKRTREELKGIADYYRSPMALPHRLPNIPKEIIENNKREYLSTPSVYTTKTYDLYSTVSGTTSRTSSLSNATNVTTSSQRSIKLKVKIAELEEALKEEKEQRLALESSLKQAIATMTSPTH